MNRCFAVVRRARVAPTDLRVALDLVSGIVHVAAVRRHIATLLLTASSLPLCATALRAQAVTGVGDDAIPIARRTVRYGIAAVWSQWGTVFAPDANGGTTRRPLLGPLVTPNLGVRLMPQLTGVEHAIRALSGRTDFSLSLGALEANGIVRQSVVPFAVDIGITRRVSVGVMVPYVESKQSTQLILNRTGTGATVGQNPAYATTGGAATRASNALLLKQIANARSLLAAEVTRCAVSSATGCDAVRTGSAKVQELLQLSQMMQGALAVVYGDSVRGGSPVVPLTGSTPQQAINTALTALRVAFEGFGVTSISSSSVPTAATTISGPASLPTIAADSAYGLQYRDLGGKRRAGIGDVDVTASFLLWDSFRADPLRRLQHAGRAIRSVASLGWRVGSAGGDRVEDAFDVPIGDGANAILARSTTDLVLNRRYWLSATARLVRPLQDRVTTAVPYRVDSTTFNAFRVSAGDRKLGQRVELELAPRASVGEFFGVSAAYMYRRQAADRLTLPSSVAGTATDATTTSETNPSRTYHALSVGVTYSSVGSYARGRSRFPVEVQLVHIAPLFASGGLTPAVATDRLEFRLYKGFPKR